MASMEMEMASWCTRERVNKKSSWRSVGCWARHFSQGQGTEQRVLRRYQPTSRFSKLSLIWVSSLGRWLLPFFLGGTFCTLAKIQALVSCGGEATKKIWWPLYLTISELRLTRTGRHVDST